MKRYRLLIFIAAFLLFKSGIQAQTWDWAKGAQGLSNINTGVRVVADTSGNVIALDNTSEAVEYGDTIVQKGVILTKYSPTGTRLWRKQLTSGGTVTGKSVACNASNEILVTGFFKDSVMFDSMHVI